MRLLHLAPLSRRSLSGPLDRGAWALTALSAGILLTMASEVGTPAVGALRPWLAVGPPVAILILLLIQEGSWSETLRTRTRAGVPYQRSTMPDESRLPTTADDVTFWTRFTDSLQLPTGAPYTQILDELEATLLRLGIAVVRSVQHGQQVLRYRCSVEEALLLRYGSQDPSELEEALLREYPWLQSSRRELSRRLALLRLVFERAQAAPLPAPARRIRRRSTLN